MLLALLLACADKNVSIDDRKFDIERLDPIFVDVDLSADDDFHSIEVTMPALSSRLVRFDTYGTNYFAVVIEEGLGLVVTPSQGFGPVKRLTLNFRSLRYAVFNDPLVQGHVLSLEVKNDTLINGVKMFIGYSDSPDYLPKYQRQSGGSSILDEHVTWRYRCTELAINGVKQPRVCTEYKR